MQIVELSLTALSAAIHAKAVSRREVMQAYLARIAALNPAHNARQPAQCRRAAARGNTAGLPPPESRHR
jgi:Asp-tRNA(Asn)/Glu-tRNA(Gln) amidotransferase A subunit family amidase